MGPWFSNSTTHIDPLLAATVEAVKLLQRAPSGVTAMAVGQYLELDKSTALRRLRRAESIGLVVNLETGPNRAGQYRTAEDAGQAATLPTWEEIA